MNAVQSGMAPVTNPPSRSFPEDSNEILSWAPASAAARLRYGPAPSQYCDLYLPSGTFPHPLLVVFHGGFWRSRYDLSHMSHLCAAYARAGIATLNVEYRRVGEPGGGFPGTFEDVLGALAFASRLSRQYPVHAGAPAVLGFSAGGHLAAWAAARHHLTVPDRFTGNSEIPLVISLAGVTQLYAAWADGLSQNAVEAFLGGSPLSVPEHYAASPALTPRKDLEGMCADPAWMRAQGRPAIAGAKPTEIVIAHGVNDDIVPHWYSESYADTAKRRGDRVHMLSFEGVGHYGLIDPRSAAFAQVVGLVKSLLLRHWENR